MRRVRATNVALEKPQSLHIYCVLLDLVIQHAMRIRRIVVCGLIVTTLFSRLSHKRHDLGREILKIKCF